MLASFRGWGHRTRAVCGYGDWVRKALFAEVCYPRVSAILSTFMLRAEASNICLYSPPCR